MLRLVQLRLQNFIVITNLPQIVRVVLFFPRLTERERVELVRLGRIVERAHRIGHHIDLS